MAGNGAFHGTMEISVGTAVVKIAYGCGLSISDVELEQLKQALENTARAFLVGRLAKAMPKPGVADLEGELPSSNQPR